MKKARFILLLSCCLPTVLAAQDKGLAKTGLLISKLPASVGQDKVSLYGLVALSYHNNNREAEALAYAAEGQNLAKELNWVIGQAKLNMISGDIHTKKKAYNEACRYYLKALQLSDSVRNYAISYDASLALGAVCEAQENNKDAFSNYYMAMANAEKLGSEEKVYEALITIASLEYRQPIPLYAQALEKYEKARSYAMNTGNRHMLADILYSITNIHIAQNDTGNWLGYTLNEARNAGRYGDTQTAALWNSLVAQMAPGLAIDTKKWYGKE